jgi:C_GCAxxG_C_C family probable redox protein
MDKNEPTSERSNRAGELFRSGFNCAQSVFSSFARETGLTKDQALKITSGFGGGMGRMQYTCGAVVGAYLVISALNGSADASDLEARDKTYKLVRKFEALFTEKHGSTNCRELIKYDLNVEEQREEALEKGVFEVQCTGFVQDAVELLENEILD